MARRSEGNSFPRGLSPRVIQGFLNPDIANPKCITYMKPLSTHLPTEHLSRYDRRRVGARPASPATEQHYQTTIEATASTTSSKERTPASQTSELRSFRQLGMAIDDDASRWSFALEMLVFGLVIAVVAWPLISLLILLAQTARG